MHETLTSRGAEQQPHYVRSVAVEVSGGILRDEILRISRLAKRGVRSLHTIELEKRLEKGHNRACHTVVDLLFTAMDNGVSVDTVEHVARTLHGLLRTRAGLAPTESLNQVIRREGDVDCRLDAIQLALHDGECSTENLMAASKLITEQVDALLALRDKVNERLFARGPRMVAP